MQAKLTEEKVILEVCQQLINLNIIYFMAFEMSVAFARFLNYEMFCDLFFLSQEFLPNLIL